jgi:hypothetical protein
MLMLTDGNLDNASARIRAIRYIPFFEAQGYRVTHIPRIPQRPTNPFLKFTVSEMIIFVFATGNELSI